MSAGGQKIQEVYLLRSYIPLPNSSNAVFRFGHPYATSFPLKHMMAKKDKIEVSKVSSVNSMADIKPKGMNHHLLWTNSKCTELVVCNPTNISKLDLKTNTCTQVQMDAPKDPNSNWYNLVKYGNYSVLFPRDKQPNVYLQDKLLGQDKFFGVLAPTFTPKCSNSLSTSTGVVIEGPLLYYLAQGSKLAYFNLTRAIDALAASKEVVEADTVYANVLMCCRIRNGAVAVARQEGVIEVLEKEGKVDMKKKPDDKCSFSAMAAHNKWLVAGLFTSTTSDQNKTVELALVDQNNWKITDRIVENNSRETSEYHKIRFVPIEKVLYLVASKLVINVGLYAVQNGKMHEMIKQPEICTNCLWTFELRVVKNKRKYSLELFFGSMNGIDKIVFANV